MQINLHQRKLYNMYIVMTKAANQQWPSTRSTSYNGKGEDWMVGNDGEVQQSMCLSLI